MGVYGLMTWLGVGKRKGNPPASQAKPARATAPPPARVTAPAMVASPPAGVFVEDDIDSAEDTCSHDGTDLAEVTNGTPTQAVAATVTDTPHERVARLTEVLTLQPRLSAAKPGDCNLTTVLVDGSALLIMCILLPAFQAHAQAMGTTVRSHLLSNATGGDLDRVGWQVQQVVENLFHHYGVRLVFAFDGQHMTRDGAAEAEQALLDAERRRVCAKRDDRRRNDLKMVMDYLDDDTKPFPANTYEAARSLKRMLPPGGMKEAHVRLARLAKRGLAEVVYLGKEMDAEVEGLCAEYRPLFVLSNDSDMVIYPKVPGVVFLDDVPLHAIVTAKTTETVMLPVYSHEKLCRYLGLSSEDLARCAALNGNDVTGESTNPGHERSFADIAAELATHRNASRGDGVPPADTSLVRAAITQYMLYSWRCEENPEAPLPPPVPRETDPYFPKGFRTLRDYGTWETSACLLRCGVFCNLYNHCAAFGRVLETSAALAQLPEHARDAAAAHGHRRDAFTLRFGEEEDEVRPIAKDLLRAVGDSREAARAHGLEILGVLLGMKRRVLVERYRAPRATRELFTTCVLWAVRSRSLDEKDMTLVSRAMGLSMALLQSDLLFSPGDKAKLQRTIAHFAAKAHAEKVKPSSRLVELGHAVRDAFSVFFDLFQLLALWDPLDASSALMPSEFFSGTLLLLCECYASELASQYLPKTAFARVERWLPGVRGDARWAAKLPDFFNPTWQCRHCTLTE